ncbi:polysaccharide deacetylase family protein [Rubrolithibacter danxiaensis]|uniref:polysaccharide deacetylase family protein n=1 Tax=Rubrolithibacter danxiaensis TaxID=3390805 RepID=UPI003BF8ADBE
MYLVKTPFWLRLLYPSSLTWNKSRTEKSIYLTFDDGPIPIVTPFVLETLKSFDIKATFFCIGDNIRKHPEIFSSINNEGHRVGNHTYNHLKGWTTEDGEYIDNILKCHQLVNSHLFRPPYGRIKKSQIKTLLSSIPDLKIIMWDVLSGDFDVSLSPEKCLSNVIRKTGNGAIVVFHDSLKAKPRIEYALPRAIQYWKDKGYTFRTL